MLMFVFGMFVGFCVAAGIGVYLNMKGYKPE